LPASSQVGSRTVRQPSKVSAVSVARTGPDFSSATIGSPSVLAIDTTCTRGMLLA
jgi:hypothetical protein